MKLMHLVILILTWFQVGSARADGGINGGGGNSYAILVEQEISHLVDLMRNAPAGELHGIEWLSLQDAVTATRLEMTNGPLEIDGKPVEAINYPMEKRIVFSMSAIARIQGTKAFSTLVLHEFLGVLRMDDSHYALSVPTVEYLARSPQTLNFRGGYDSITCKVLVNGREIAGETSTAFHGVDLKGNSGHNWYAYLTSDLTNGSRRLFFRMEVRDSLTRATLAELEIPADQRIEASLEVPNSADTLYCWVNYRVEK